MVHIDVKDVAFQYDTDYDYQVIALTISRKCFNSWSRVKDGFGRKRTGTSITTTVTWYWNTVKICLTIELKRVVNPRAGIKYFICLSLFAVCKWCIVFLNMYNSNTQVCVTAFTTTMGRGDYSRDEFRPVLFKVCRN